MEEVRKFLGPWFLGATAKVTRHTIARRVYETLRRRYRVRHSDEHHLPNYDCPYQLKRITSGLEHVQLSHTFVDVVNDREEDHILIEVIGSSSVVKHFAYTSLRGPYEYAIRDYYPKFVIKLPENFYLFLANPFHALGIAARLYEGMTFKDAGNTVLLHCPTKKVEAKPDKEYNKIVGIEDQVFTGVIEDTPEFVYNENSIDPAIYKTFEEACNNSCRDRSGKDYGKKMSNNPASTEFIHSASSLQFLHATKCRDIFTPEQWLMLSNGIISKFVVPVTKPDNVTSDGKLRVIYSMPPTLEAWLRMKFRYMRYDNLPGYVSNPFDEIDESLEYSYDVIKCDERVAQYWYKYCVDNHKEELDLLYPMVKNGQDMYRPNKLPSGVIHTSLVVNLFVHAYLRTYCPDMRYQFQGDGIILSEKIRHHSDWFREVCDCKLNGFNKGQYMRPWKLVQHAWLRKGGYPVGRIRYWVRYYVYRSLNADLVGIEKPKYKLNGLSIDSATPSQVAEFLANRRYKIPYKLQLLVEKQPQCKQYSELVCRDVTDYRIDYVSDDQRYVVLGQTMVQSL